LGSAAGTLFLCHFGTPQILILRPAFALAPSNSFVSPTYTKTGAWCYLNGNVSTVCRRADIPGTTCRASTGGKAKARRNPRTGLKTGHYIRESTARLRRTGPTREGEKR